MTDPMVRIGHCSPDAPNVDIQVDGETVFEDVAFRDLSDYTTLAAGDHMVRIKPAGSDDTVVEMNPSLEEDTRYTALATGMLDDIDITVFTDEPGDVPSNKTHVRFIHASPDAPRVGISVRDGPDLFKRMQFRNASDYEQVDAGSYDLDVIPTGNREPALSLDGIEFNGGAAYSAIAVGLVEDGSLDALLVEDTVAELAADD